MAPKGELLRLVAVVDSSQSDGPALPGAVRRSIATIDRAGTLPGRGAYLCRAAGAPVLPRRECLLAATRKGGLQRTLRRSVQLDPELIAAGSLESEG